MTRNEEFLVVYADMLENVIYAKMGTEDGNTILKKTQETARRLRLSDKAKEMIDQCKLD